MDVTSISGGCRFLKYNGTSCQKEKCISCCCISEIQDFYEQKEAQAILTSSDTKLFLAQDKSEIEYIREVFKLSEGEAGFLSTCTRGQGLLKIGSNTAILQIIPTEREFQFVETNMQKIAAMQGDTE